MHTSYTVGITTGEYKALTTVMIDQQDWVTNALKNQARKTTLDITRKYTQFKIDRSERNQRLQEELCKVDADYCIK